MLKRRSIRRIVFGLVGICLISIMAMPVQAKEKITYRVIGLYDLTGPYSALHQLAVKGIKDFVAWANKEPGYFPPGVQWSHEIYDTGMEIGKAVAAYQMACSKKPAPIITTGGLASPTVIAIKPLAKRKKIPCIDGTSARPIMVPPAWTFSILGCYEGIAAASAQFLKDNWREDTPYERIRKRYKESNGRRPRFTVIGWDNAFGRAFDSKEVREYVEKIGVDWVEPEYVSLSASDTTPQVLRLVKRGADMIFFGMYPNTHACILKDAARLGVRDKFQDMCFWSDDLIQLTHYAGDLANGTLMLTGWNMVVDEWPPVFREMFRKTGWSDANALGYSLGIAWFDLYGEAIRQAVKKVGAPNVTGSVVYDVLTSMTDYRPLNYNSKVSFTKTKRFGADTACVYQNQNGKIVKVRESIYVPDLLPGGKDVVK